MSDTSKIIVRLFFLLICATPIAVNAQDESHYYLPLSKGELSKRFSLKYLGTSGPEISSSRFSIGPSGAVLQASENGDWVFTGKDSSDKAWSIQTGPFTCAGSGSYFYQADLDKNGLQDLIILAPTCGVGLAPSSHIVSITFDSQGRPLFFEADGYFSRKDKGIFDIVDLDSDGRAELIYMNFDKGYWITYIYEVTNGRWQRIKGRHAQRSYPLFTRFTFRENYKATTPKRGRNPFAPDLSNRASDLKGRLVSYQWAKVNYSEDISLKVIGAGGKQTICKPASWYSSFSVIADRSNGRRIVALSAREDTVKEILGEIAAYKYSVALYGQRRAKDCSPELMWAR